MLSFVIAIAIFAFQDDSIQQGVVAVPAAIVLFLLVCEINIHWKWGKHGTPWEQLRGKHVSFSHPVLELLAYQRSRRR